jgi:hypothetical protein
MVYLTTQGDSLRTGADGIVQFAPSPGVHTVLAHSFGWADASETRTVTQGGSETVVLTIVPKPVVMFTGVVRTTAGGGPLAEGEVSLAYTTYHDHAAADGVYMLHDVPDDTYRLEVRRAGHIPIELDRRIGPAFPGQDYALTPAQTWLDLQSGTGWTVGAAGDNATAGLWTRVTPVGTGDRPIAGSMPMGPAPARARHAWPFDLQHEEPPALATINCAPYLDHSPGSASMCWVTGQSPDSTNIYSGDVDAGRTSLTTPAFNMTGMAIPTIGYWRWFASYYPIGLSNGHNGPDPDDFLITLISNDNGSNWTVVDTTRGLENHWKERAVRVADYVTPTTQVKLRFVAAELGAPGVDTACEAAIDDLTLYDAANLPVGVPPARGAGVSFRAPWPNPAAGDVRLVLDLPERGDVNVEVADVTGRRIATLYRGTASAGPLTLAWDGRDATGREAPAGLYFARADVRDPAGGMPTHHSTARFVRVR